MKRDLLQYLTLWKNRSKRKPILLRGARQVGKSWLARKLGETFTHYIEINFEKNSDLCAFFQSDLDAKKIAFNLANYFSTKITPGKTLLFLDEIQVCPKAISALRYFYEDFPELHVIGAGSLLEFELQKISAPVGRIEIIYVYPLSFAEYLTASGKQNLRDLIFASRFQEIAEPFHKQLQEEIRNYTLLGGMPEVVASYLENHDFEQSCDLQSILLETFRRDFNKYAKKYQINYLNRIFDLAPLQTGNKFKYSQVDKDIKSRELAGALELLEMAGLLYRVYHSSANGIPLRAEMDPKKFKVLFFDIGLTQRLLKVDYRQLFLNPDIALVNNGAIAELLTGLELIAHQPFKERPESFYWHREERSSNAEVDYVINLGPLLVPIEVKSGTTGRLKSLHSFMKTKKSQLGIKISSGNFSHPSPIQIIPFYGIELLMKNHQSLNPK